MKKRKKGELRKGGRKGGKEGVEERGKRRKSGERRKGGRFHILLNPSYLSFYGMGWDGMGLRGVNIRSTYFFSL